MNFMVLIKNVFKHPKSSVAGLGVFGSLLLIWFTPEHAKEILTAVATLWGAVLMISQDKK